MFFYINNLIFFQVRWFTIFFFFSIILLSKFNNFFSKFTTDISFLFIQLYFMIIILLVSKNFLTVFLVLEVINLLIIYSFLITPTRYGISNSKVLFQDNWIIKSCVYQFFLNFFSSILFFWAYNALIGLTQTTNFFFLTQITNNYYIYNIYMSILYSAFLIKLGVGPWLVFKIEIYQNFNILLMVIYTLIYFLGILIFFFNLFFIYKLPVTNLFLVLCLIILLCFFLTFLTNLFNYFNIYMFFSFSSLAHLIIFILQLVIILVLFK